MTTTVEPAAAPDQDELLRWEPGGSARGDVDGRWSPRSRDLAAELPGLLAALTDRFGTVERVSSHFGAGGRSPHRLAVARPVVRVDGFRTMPPGTVDVTSGYHRITLAVVRDPSEPESHEGN